MLSQKSVVTTYFELSPPTRPILDQTVATFYLNNFHSSWKLACFTIWLPNRHALSPPPPPTTIRAPDREENFTFSFSPPSHNFPHFWKWLLQRCQNSVEWKSSLAKKKMVRKKGFSFSFLEVSFAVESYVRLVSPGAKLISCVAWR